MNANVPRATWPSLAIVRHATVYAPAAILPFTGATTRSESPAASGASGTAALAGPVTFTDVTASSGGCENHNRMASGAAGIGAVYTDSGEPIHILRKILIRVSAKLDWLILKLH